MTEDTETTFAGQNLDLERYRVRFGLYKVIFGTALVGILGVVVPGAVEFWRVTFEDRRLQTQSAAETQRRAIEMQIDQINQQQAFVRDFLETALNQDIELRIRLADYFSKVSAEPFREDWMGYRDALMLSRNQTRDEINAMEEALLRGMSVPSPTVEQQIENARLGRELEWRYREIGYVARNRSIVRSEGETEEAARTLAAATDAGDLVRIIMHWTGGGHRATPLDRQYYHEVVEGDGTRVRGLLPPEANAVGAVGPRVAHTLNLNVGSIGLAMAAMNRATYQPFSPGDAPITVAQLEAFCLSVTDYARQFNIPITRETVLSHAEVQPTLGVQQRFRSDITWLPGMVGTGEPVAVGDLLRDMMRAHGDDRCVYRPEAAQSVVGD
jgi:hypothetical protein